MLKYFIAFASSLFLLQSILSNIFSSHPYYYTLIAVLYCLITIQLYYLKYETLCAYFNLYGISIYCMIRSIILQSTTNLYFICIMIIVSAIIISIKCATIIFSAVMIHSVVLTISGFFSYGIVNDPITGIEYSNSTINLFPLLISSYVVSYLISKIISGDIITQRKQNEFLQEIKNMVMSQERLRSITILAGGVAHDFNNLLTSIIGNIDMVQDDIEELDISSKEDLQNSLNDAINATNQAKNLAEQLMTLSKGGTVIEKTSVDINDLIIETVNFSLSGSKSKPTFTFNPRLWKINVDKGQLRQVIQNLIINANQAMNKGGNISIKTDNLLLEPENSIELIPGKYIIISISDEGPGISEENQVKIFDPFYTTKSNGTGLGLSICNSIIQKHQGKIIIDSKLEQGTTFHIYIPM